MTIPFWVLQAHTLVITILRWNPDYFKTGIRVDAYLFNSIFHFKLTNIFDQILNFVKEHLGNNPEVAKAIPAGQEDAVHR